ncbi:MAG: helix-turn-helix transcriptional regulator [Clostridia bacterium]|nr:helix-turn-helix transcriptional regulator [Clostridia bacterium]
MLSTKQLANNIRAVSKQTKISVKSVLEQCGINRNFIYDLEQNETQPAMDKIIAIANAFGVTPEHLISETNSTIECKSVNTDTYTNELVTVYQKLNSQNKVKVLNYAYELADEEASLTAKSVAKTGQEKKTKDITELEMLKRELKQS